MLENISSTQSEATQAIPAKESLAELKNNLNQLVEDEINEWKKEYLTPESPPELLDHFLQIQRRIKAGWFYSEIDDPFYAWHTTPYDFFFERFRLSAKTVAEIGRNNQETSKKSQNLNRVESVLKIMEALNPPSLDYFINHAKLYGKLQETVGISNGAAAALSIERLSGSELNPNLPDYAMQIKLVDRDGKLIHDFGKDVKPGTMFFAWHKDEADLQQKWIHVSLFQKQGYYNKGNFIERLSDEAIFVLCHEIGHHQQFGDPSFIEMAKKVEGENWTPDYSPFAERDAWVRGVKILKSIKNKEGKRLFAPDKKERMYEKLRKTIISCLATRSDERFTKGYKTRKAT